MEKSMSKEKKEEKEIKEKNIKKEKELNEKKENKNDEKKPKKLIIIISIIMGIIIVIGIIFSTIFALINISNSNIISGIKIQNIDVSGLSKEEAKTKLEIICNKKLEKEIELEYSEYKTTLTPEIIELKYNIEEAVEEALKIGKDNNIIVNNYKIIFALMGKENIELTNSLNEENIIKNIEVTEQDIPGIVKEPGYYIEGEKLIITKGIEGLKIDYERLIEKIKNSINDINTIIENIEIPVVNKKPEEINIEKIYEEVHKDVQDAYYTKEPFEVHPEVEGIDFDIEKAKEILKEDKEQYEIDLIITKPKITIAQIGSEAFPDLLGTYSTKYDGSDVQRTTNLRLATEKINNKVILPGETFSYNQTLGERTAAAGYKNAKVYENGQVVDGIGGGICQISSTLYNAVLMSNLDIIERRNHQFVTSYTPAGRDATVVYGYTDFRFKNTRDYAIKIQANISNGIATVSIYGIKTDTEYTVTFSNKTISTIPFTVQYVDDNTLQAGTEKVKQKGANGSVVETYITKSLNGKVVSSQLLSRDTYNAMQRIILRGINGATITQEPSNTPIQEAPKQEKPIQETPKQEKPKKDPSKQEQPTQQAPVQNQTTTLDNNSQKSEGE